MGQKAVSTSDLLHGIWDAQRRYNDRVKIGQLRTSEEWTTAYLLGLLSEADEVLRELRWKSHRKTDKPVNRFNVAEELADLTKYVFSLWQQFDFTPEEMLQAIQRKSDYMEQKWAQEFAPAPKGKFIIVADVDGTLADFRGTLWGWMFKRKYIGSFARDPAQNLNMAIDMKLSPSSFHQWKAEFEESGGYRSLIPFMDTLKVIRSLQRVGAMLVVVSARPITRAKRIWYDTWNWLHENGIEPDRMCIGDERAFLIEDLAKDNKVVLLDDDPDNILRSCDLCPVFVRSWPYNERVRNGHPNITHYEHIAEVEATLSELLNEYLAGEPTC
jgi:NTP pyrophosphatase (non-canonical NTP hydrolase)